MTSRQPLPRAVGPATLLIVALVATMGGVACAQSFDFLSVVPGHPSAGAVLRWGALPWLAWLALAPLIAVVACAFPVGSGQTTKSVAVHVLVALILAFGVTWLETLVPRPAISMGSLTRVPPPGLDQPAPPFPSDLPSSRIMRFDQLPEEVLRQLPRSGPGALVSPNGQSIQIPAEVLRQLPRSGPGTVVSPDGQSIQIPEEVLRQLPRSSTGIFVLPEAQGKSFPGGVSIERATGKSPLAIAIRFVTHVLTYAVLAGAVLGMGIYRHGRDQADRADRYQRQLAQAQLATLRMQLRPHFLFNTLNSVVTLMSRDVDGARRMVHRLSDLLRASLDAMKEEQVELQQEIALLRSYFEIEQLRFGDRVRFAIDVPSELYAAMVPSFCLQPLAENAVKHGLEQSDREGEIRLTVTQEGEERIVLEMWDNGFGLDGIGLDGEPSMGVGLGNTRKRLQEIYGDDADIELDSPESGGFAVRMRLPLQFREAGGAASA